MPLPPPGDRVATRQRWTTAPLRSLDLLNAGGASLVIGDLTRPDRTSIPEPPVRRRDRASTLARRFPLTSRRTCLPQPHICSLVGAASRVQADRTFVPLTGGQFAVFSTWTYSSPISWPGPHVAAGLCCVDDPLAPDRVRLRPSAGSGLRLRSHPHRRAGYHATFDGPLRPRGDPPPAGGRMRVTQGRLRFLNAPLRSRWELRRRRVTGLRLRHPNSESAPAGDRRSTGRIR